MSNIDRLPISVSKYLLSCRWVRGLNIRSRILTRTYRKLSNEQSEAVIVCCERGSFRPRFYAISQSRLVCCLPIRPKRCTQIADLILTGQANQSWQTFVWLFSFTHPGHKNCVLLIDLNRESPNHWAPIFHCASSLRGMNDRTVGHRSLILKYDTTWQNV